MKAPSPIHGHYNTTCHDISIGNFSTVGREDQNIASSIKEVILIRVSDQFLNRKKTYTNCHIYGLRCWWIHIGSLIPWTTTNKISLITSWLPVHNICHKHGSFQHQDYNWLSLAISQHTTWFCYILEPTRAYHPFTTMG